MLCELCPIVIMVYSTLYFCTLQVVVSLFGINFYKSACTFILFGLVPLSGRILGGLENTTG